MQYPGIWKAWSHCNAGKGASKSARTTGGYAVFGALRSERKAAGFPGYVRRVVKSLLNHDADWTMRRQLTSRGFALRLR